MGLFSSLRKAMSFSFTVVDDAPPLSPAQARGLALGATYAAKDLVPVNKLTMAADPRTAAKVLAGAWDCRTPADVEETYAYLLTAGHRELYALVNPLVQSLVAGSVRMSREEALQVLDRLRAQAAERDIDPDTVQTAYTNWYRSCNGGALGDLAARVPTSIVAWDAARVVHVSRLMVDAGLAAPERAWAAIAEAVELSRPAYGSWREYGEAFVVGRGFWTSIGSRNPTDLGLSEWSSSVQTLLEKDGSPWLTLPW